MRFQKQRYRHDPAQGTYGDCYRTVLACLLDLPRDEVPHFYDGLDDATVPEGVRLRVSQFLADRDLAEFEVAFASDPQDVMDCMAVLNPGMIYTLSGRSRTGCNHVVICKDNRILWDTSLTDAGIVGRDDTGFTRVYVYVRKLSHAP